LEPLPISIIANVYIAKSSHHTAHLVRRIREVESNPYHFNLLFVGLMFELSIEEVFSVYF